MRTRTMGRWVTVASLAVLLHGCQFEEFVLNIFRLALALSGGSSSEPGRGASVGPLPQGNEALLGAIIQRATDFLIEPGNLVVSGSLTPETPPATVPPTLRIIVRQKNGVGTVTRTLTFDLTVQSTGSIPTQVFPVAATLVDVGDRLELSVEPLGADLPPSSLTLRTRYRKT